MSIPEPTSSSSSTKTEGEPQSPPSSQINLRFISQDGKELIMKVNPKIAFGRIFKVYHDKYEAKPGTIRFTFEGQRIGDDQTPKSLEMEDNDVIDVMLQQTGGK